MRTLYSLLIFLITTSISYSQNFYGWFPITSGTNSNLYSVNNNLIAGSGGTILITSNGGNNWVTRSSGTTNDLHSIYIGTSFIYIPGSNGTLLESADNGNTWTGLNTGSTVSLNSASRGLYINSIIVIGNSGTIRSSSDGGLTWSNMSSGTSNNLYSLAYNGYNGWIAGSGGIILATTNSGANWFQQTSGTTSNLNYILRLDNNNLWAVGDNGKILSTTNGGSAWINHPSGTTSNLKSISIKTVNSWCAGSGGIVLMSNDSGLNWVEQTLTNSDLNSDYFSNDNNGLVVGNNGLIYIHKPGYVFLNANNISSIFNCSGVFDNYLAMNNTPGFEWPKGTGQDAIFSAGLTVAAKYNGNLRMASAFYNGEYSPGYIIDTLGNPTAKTNINFRMYRVTRGDNMNTNPDWANWGLMVPYGAPFVDVNHNGIYEPNIDTPGVKNAVQTIFLCMTDGFPGSHYSSEGFGGGTLPLYIESHMTAWCYDSPELMDVQFVKWDVINKSLTPWTSAYFSITSDPDLGCPNDDYIGCDTTRGLGFCYNGEDVDCYYAFMYQPPVPAVGFLWLQCSGINNQGITSIDYFTNPSNPCPACERDPNPGPLLAYHYMQGTKSEGTPWMIPPGGDAAHVTKFVYSGDPETHTGWCEANGTISGSVWNCGGPGHYTGDIYNSNDFGDRRIVLNSGSDNLTINPGDTHRVMIAQLIARGSSRLNSVTKLKFLADTVKAVCSRGIFGIEQISSTVPTRFYLSQNYPNPFNPKTIINYQLPKNSNVNLTVYNVLGEKISVLVNEKQNPGEYKVEWDGTNYPSGVYFYKIQAGNFVQSKKMILIK